MKPFLEISEQLFTKTSAYRLFENKNNIFVSTQFKTAIIDKNSKSYEIVNLQIKSVQLDEHSQNWIHAIIRNHDRNMNNAHHNMPLSHYFHSEHDIAIMTSNILIEASFNQSYLFFSNICKKGSKPKKVYPFSKQQTSIRNIKVRKNYESQLIIFHSSDQNDSDICHGFYLYDIQKQAINHEYNKQYKCFSKIILEYDNNLLVLGELCELSNSSTLRAYDIRTKLDGFIIDTCQNPYERNPVWAPNYTYFDKMSSRFQIGTVWGSGGLRKCEIVCIDIRKPFRRTVFDNPFNHLRFFKELRASNSLQKQLWSIQNLYSDYRFSGNKISRFKY